MRPPLKLGQTVQRLERRQAVEVEGLEIAHDGVRRCGRKERELTLVALERWR